LASSLNRQANRQGSEGAMEDVMFEHGLFYWNELITPDVEKAKDFYARTLGWTYEDMQISEGDYVIAKQGEAMAGGLMATPAEMEGVPSTWYSYISVDDVDARVESALQAGAQLMRPVFDIEGVGRIAILQDPTGAIIGWITPVSMDVESA